MRITHVSQIKNNIRAHDKVYDKYEYMHGEIYNPVEQERLQKKLKYAIENIKTNSSDKIALDYGCGSGNITGHLIEFGIRTIAADVSKKFLGVVKEKYSQTGLLDVLEIDGNSLCNVANDKFDLIASYSVLHHVPDYLGIVREMIRATKHGGVIYLDHEVSESFWNKSKEYVEFQQLAQAMPKKNWRKYLKPSNYLLRLSNYIFKLQRIINPKFEPEGDIHVFPDDHIEWNKIESLLVGNGCEIILKENYLLYRRGYKVDIYQMYADKCNDMRLLVVRKK